MINVTLGEVKTQEEKPFPKLMKSEDYGKVKTQEEKPFPKLMKSEDYGKVVLFTEPRKGIMITFTGVGKDLRDTFYDDYNMSLFKDYNEPITLQNA